MLSDSNKLLREEKKGQDERIKTLERQCEQLEGEMGPLRESIKQLTAQKDVLIAEKTALRYTQLKCNIDWCTSYSTTPHAGMKLSAGAHAPTSSLNSTTRLIQKNTRNWCKFMHVWESRPKSS